MYDDMGVLHQMFDEFFRRRRSSRIMLAVMIGLIGLGMVLFAAGLLYLV